MKRGILAFLLALLLCGCQAAESVPETTPDTVTATAPETVQPEALGLCGRVWCRTASGTPYALAWDTTWTGAVPSFVQGEGGALLFGCEDELFPVPGVSPGDPLIMEKLGLYASREVSAVVQGTDGGAEVLTTRDGGETWTSAQLDFAGSTSWASVGFTSPEEGWIVLCGFVGMGQELHGLYKTADGGETWTAVENNIDEVHSRVLTGAGFITPEIGFLGFRYETLDFQPAVLVTRDGGATWNKAEVSLPEDPEGWNITPLSLSWDGSRYVFLFLYTNGEEEREVSLPLDAGVLDTIHILD